MTTTAWFHCFAGIAGDMTLGACLDAGADLAEVRAILKALPVRGFDLGAEPVLRGGLAATRAVVVVRETTVARTYGHIAAMLADARLPPRVGDRAGAVFKALAGAEARLHRRPIEQVHFHEVGSLDAIVDVVGSCAALEVLGVDEVTSSPVAVGTGMIRSAHGMLPNPAPAAVDLLGDAPVVGVDINAELTTPTGAALLAGLCSGFGPIPAMTLRASGFGAGSREFATLPNLLGVAIGERDEADTARGEPVALLEVNLDDVTGEVVAHTMAALLDAGALDAWSVPVLMKKGRPGVVLSTLTHLADGPRLRDLIARETGTLGVRVTATSRWAYTREGAEVLVEGLPVRVKQAPHRRKAEHDDAARVASEKGTPLRDVIARAERPPDDDPA